jgi:hypothetical protein
LGVEQALANMAAQAMMRVLEVFILHIIIYILTLISENCCKGTYFFSKNI